MKGQIWSMDFALSLILFSAASVIAYTLLTNLFEDTAHEDVRRQAADASQLLSGEGYPQHWTRSDVIRAGITAEGRLSLRKARELGALDRDALRRSTRATDNIAIYALNGSEVSGIFGTCVLGDLSDPGTPRNMTLPAIALVSGAHPVADRVTATQHSDDAVYSALQSADVLILEGDVTAGSQRSNASISLGLHGMAQRGTTIIIVGDPGIPVFGVQANRTNATQVTLSSVALGMEEGASVSFPEQEIATIEEPAGPPVRAYEAVGLADSGKAAYATWLYGDARVWYVATAEGTLDNGTAAVEPISAAIEGMISISWPQCGGITIPPSARQIAHYDRSIIHHDQVLTVRTVVWRER